MKALLSEHPFYMQLLSFLNIVLHIFNLNRVFNASEIIETSLLNSPLLSWVFKNIVLHIYNLNWGFNVGEIIDFSLLYSLLLNWDGILDKDISRKKIQILCFLFYYKILKIIDGMNNT
jgi:hypothetical protein